MGLRNDRIPDLRELNAKLCRLTGWEAVAVARPLSPREFFAYLARRQFPTTVSIRTRNELWHIERPDIFHDVFGHLPMHAHPMFADLLQQIGQIAIYARTDDETEALARLVWFTFEFGLVEESGNIKIYGSGLASSAIDAAKALQDGGCDLRPFSFDAVIAEPRKMDRRKDLRFLLKTFSELFRAFEEASRLFAPDK